MSASFDQRALFLKHWEKESQTTRKVLARIPDANGYKPDPKSRTAREIAWLVVSEEKALAQGLETGRLEWKEVPAPASMKDVLAAYDAQHAAVLESLREAPAAHWDAEIPFVINGQTVMSMPGYDNAWGFLFDIIHHRGQISTYLRPMGSKVPQIYGPSADEP